MIDTKYSPEVHNSLPSLKESNDKFYDNNGVNLLSEIGEIFIKYDLNKNFGLILLHKHFKQSDTEYLVEIISDDKTITTKWENNKPKNKEVLKKYNVEYILEDDNYIQPHSWVINKDYELLPYEFYVKKSKTLVTTPEESFIEELYNKLENYNLHNILGLHFLHRQFESLVEDTDEEYHANVLVIEPEEYDKSKYTEVIWTFGNNGPTRCHCRCYKPVGGSHQHGCS